MSAVVYGAGGSSKLQPWANIAEDDVEERDKKKQETYTALEYY